MGVLVKPIISEKTSAQQEQSKFGFIVDKEANKIQIKDEIEKTYGVTVLSVNTLIQPGTKKTRYTKSRIISGRTAAFKKAVVTLKDGDFIDFYSGI